MTKLKGMRGTCFSSEATSYIVDAIVSRSLLEVLTRKLGIVISMEAMDGRAKDMVMLIKKQLNSNWDRLRVGGLKGGEQTSQTNPRNSGYIS
jgi:proteasome assembly chaperone (PAC2) family protein